PHLARFPPLPLLPHPHHVSPLLSSHCPARHRDLHSFPTRRSSDLSPTLFADQALLHVLVSGPSSRSDQQSGEGCPAVGDQPRGQAISPAGIKAETRKVLGLLVPEGRKSFTNIEIIIIIRLTHGGWTAALSKGFCPAEGVCFPQEHLFKGARVS